MSRTFAAARLAALSALTVGLATLALPASVAGASSNGHSAREELVSRAGGHATFSAAHGTAGVFFGTQRGHAATRPVGISRQDAPAVAAKEWMARYGAAFGISDADRDLHAARSTAIAGGTAVRLQQTVSGLPVVGGELSVVLDDQNQLVSVLGHVSPAVAVSTTPSVTATTAKALAVRAVAKHQPGSGRLTASEPVLSVLDQSVLGGPVVTGPLPVWATRVSSAGGTVRHSVYVEATRGVIALDLDDNPRAKRIVCTAGGKRVSDPTCPSPWSPPKVTTVTNPAASTDPDVVNAYRFAGAVDHFYSFLLNRNSLDGLGMTLASTVRYCPLRSDTFDNSCPYDNAFWDGDQMVYGAGYTSGLDVVGHEMTHGVTQFTSNLISYYQSGAINESQSDVMGELIQQIEGPSLNATGTKDVYDAADAWKIGEDLSKFGGPFRHMDHPESDTTVINNKLVAAPDPDRMTSAYYDATPYYVDQGGVHENAGVGNKAAFLIAHGADGDGTFNGYAISGVAGDGVTANVDSAGTTEDQIVKDVKTANIYYQLDKMMVSAATYADLYKLLPQACDSLVDTPAKRMPSGWSISTTTITSADCDQVRLAVKATEMNVLPTKPGAAVPTAAPYCTNGGYATGRRVDTFETSPWSAGTYRRTYNQARGEFGSWWWTRDYQLRGSKASLWGEDADPFAESATGTYEDTRVQKVAAVKAAVGTFVRFRTAWSFDTFTGTKSTYNFDGGVVEYSVDGGKKWHDAGGLFVSNGYNGRITNTTDLASGYVDPNPLKGRRAFVRDSHGWTASRLDLSSLAGRSVLLRWRIGADDSGSALGWFVDNVERFGCNPTHASISAQTRVHSGHPAVVVAHVVRAGTTTSLANLPVALWEKRHSATQWTYVGTKITNKYGKVHWSRTHTTVEDYRVRMTGKRPFAPSNLPTATVRLF